jgi:protoheme IX farnesyltransferase
MEKRSVKTVSIAPSESYLPLSRLARLQWLVRAVRPYVELTKPRIILFLLFTQYGAMVVAERCLPPLGITIAALLGLGLTAGGSAAVNMWYDRDIDKRMARTAGRPLPAGAVRPVVALVIGMVLGAAGFVWLYATAGALTAALALAGYIYYAVVYTMWLKRRTPQNIVIGGGAGAFPPLVGWAAATGHLAWPAWLLFAVIFFWTPSHFWGLALYRNDDYIRAGVPMLPVVRGPRTTKWQMTAYTIVLVFVSLLLGPAVHADVVYEIVAALLGVFFLLGHWYLLREPDDEHVWAKRIFLASLGYLPAIYTALAICAVV